MTKKTIKRLKQIEKELAIISSDLTILSNNQSMGIKYPMRQLANSIRYCTERFFAFESVKVYTEVIARPKRKKKNG